MVFETVTQRCRRESYEAILKKNSDKKVSLVTCTECRHVSENEERYKAHLKEPRHINNYRDLAYKGTIHLLDSRQYVTLNKMFIGS